LKNPGFFFLMQGITPVLFTGGHRNNLDFEIGLAFALRRPLNRLTMENGLSNRIDKKMGLST